MVNTFRTSRLLADEAIWGDESIPERRESARFGCCMHLRDLANAHPKFAPPKAVEFVRQWEVAARERLRERQQRKTAQCADYRPSLTTSSPR